MGEEVIQTEVDKLVDILKIKRKMSLSQMAKELNIDQNIVQEWVDFLVEEKIIGLDYEFTKPIIYIIEPKEEIKEFSKKDYEKYKQRFKEGAKREDGQPEFAWKQHIIDTLELKKHFFFIEAEKRNLKKIEQLWEEYKKKASEL